MKTPHFLALATLLTAATPAFADTVTFANGAADVALFNSYGSAGTATSNYFTYNATAGVGGGPGMTHALNGQGGGLDNTAIYTPFAADFTNVGASYTMSVMINSSSFSTQSFQIGFTSSSTQGFYGNTGYNFISFRTTSGSIPATQVMNNGASTNTTLSPNPTFTNNNWYNYSLTLTKSATANTFNYVASIDNWGASGASLLSNAFTNSGTLTNTALYTDSTVYAGIRPNAAASFDNFIVTAVPEPSTYGLLGAGALAAATLVQRRRSAKRRTPGV